ncbi:hypothetical protein BD626DRAFT_268606 [Schizophyllum amplum]|uniref:Uncharacterized protein n=1 Tax=Schizophyllum amplum TaxID=97359 RepID=A0A550BTT9_9AGAR|nr:hypothetical protein BD626DRAFT_268606 [Auriculariopsis ampla]
MHETLYTLDILNLILDDAELQQADLFHCALVCSLWRDVAVPKIWEDLRSLEALFRLVPKESLHLDYDAVEGLPSGLDRDGRHHVVPSGWEILFQRAALAKRLVLDISVLSRDQQRAIVPLISHAPTFPSLRRLVLHGPLQREIAITSPCLSLRLLDSSDHAWEASNLQSIETDQTPLYDVIRLFHLPRARTLHSISVTAQIPNPTSSPPSSTRSTPPSTATPSARYPSRAPSAPPTSTNSRTATSSPSPTSTISPPSAASPASSSSASGVSSWKTRTTPDARSGGPSCASSPWSRPCRRAGTRVYAPSAPSRRSRAAARISSCWACLWCRWPCPMICRRCLSG